MATHIGDLTINGARIISLHSEPERGGRFILVDQGEGVTQRYVTAWQWHRNGCWASEWQAGHYYTFRQEAVDDFAVRIIRGW